MNILLMCLDFPRVRKYHIDGNDNGRSDYLFEFDHPEIAFNPIARLKFPDLKWTSDFVDNFELDYLK